MKKFFSILNIFMLTIGLIIVVSFVDNNHSNGIWSGKDEYGNLYQIDLDDQILEVNIDGQIEKGHYYLLSKKETLNFYYGVILYRKSKYKIVYPKKKLIQGSIITVYKYRSLNRRCEIIID